MIPDQRDLNNRIQNLTRIFVNNVFYDRTGVVLFLGLLLCYAFTWRISFLINDNYVIANTLVGVGEGHLYTDRIAYGSLSGVAPGMHIVGDQLYGRNFGQVFLAVPFLGLLEALALIADPRIAVVGGWSLLLIVFADQTGILLGRRDLVASVGAIVAFLIFVANVALADPLWPYWFELAALQLSSIVAAAFVAVLLYRLFSDIHDRRTGLFAGVMAGLASPLAFWATIPKRHSFTALFVMATAYSLYRSRAASTERSSLRFRGLAYVWVGLMAWVHAPEGVILLVALGLVDIATARWNGPRHFVVVGAALTLAMVPVLVTNATISGDPLAVPRTLPAYQGPGATAGSGRFLNGGSGSSGGTSGDWVGFTVLNIALAFGNQLLKGVEHLGHPIDIYQTFIAWESPTDVLLGSATDRRELTVLQSMPLVGVVLSAPLAVYIKVKRGETFGIEVVRPSPARAVDAFAVAYLIVLLLIYLPRLPLHTTMTVRYLHPLYPLGIYLVARLSIVRAVLHRELTLLARSYGGFVLLLGALHLVALHNVSTAANSPVQFHGVIALISGILLAIWSVIATLQGGYERTGAVTIGLAAAVTTLFVVFSAFIYFTAPSDIALPIGEIIADTIRLR